MDSLVQKILGCFLGNFIIMMLIHVSSSTFITSLSDSFSSPVLSLTGLEKSTTREDLMEMIFRGQMFLTSGWNSVKRYVILLSSVPPGSQYDSIFPFIINEASYIYILGQLFRNDQMRPTSYLINRFSFCNEPHCFQGQICKVIIMNCYYLGS